MLSLAHPLPGETGCHRRTDEAPPPRSAAVLEGGGDRGYGKQRKNRCEGQRTGPLESHQVLVKDGGPGQGEEAAGRQGLKQNVSRLGSRVMELGL